MSSVSIRDATCNDMSELCCEYDLILPLSSGDEHFHIAVGNGGRGYIVGYVCSIKKEEEVKKEVKIYTEINHVVVLTTFQRLGIATKLVTAAHKDLEQIYHPEYILALVPRYNIPAFILLQKALDYDIYETDCTKNSYSLYKPMPSGETK